MSARYALTRVTGQRKGQAADDAWLCGAAVLCGVCLWLLAGPPLALPRNSAAVIMGADKAHSNTIDDQAPTTIGDPEGRGYTGGGGPERGGRAIPKQQAAHASAAHAGVADDTDDDTVCSSAVNIPIILYIVLTETCMNTVRTRMVSQPRSFC